MPHTGTIKAQTVFCLTEVLKNFPYDYNILFSEGCVLHYIREKLVMKAIEIGCTHILFIDSDMQFNQKAVLKLLARKKDIVGANYNRRSMPLSSTVILPQNKQPKGLVTVIGVATGFLLINLDVFRTISHPWFFWEVTTDGETVTGEDFWFCKKAREAGYKVWADFTLPIKHLGEFAY